MSFLCKRISQSCGDIRVVFDIMKTALQMLHDKIEAIQFKDIAEVKPQLTITMPMIVTIFDSKKGLRIKDTLLTLPRQDILVLDSICNLFDDCGEEKCLGMDLLFHELHSNCKKNGVEVIDQKQMAYCMEELEYYGFIDIVKGTKKQAKDIKTRKFKLKVDLHELCTELDKHPQISRRVKEEKVEEEKPQPSYLDRGIKLSKENPNDVLKRLRMQTKMKEEEAERLHKQRKLDNPQDDDSSELSDIDQ